MKYLLSVIISFSIVFATFAETSNSQLLKEAGDFYKKHEYEKAIDAYEKVLATGYEAAELYYNLGNSFYKSNKFTLAILNYERAKLLQPNNEDINFNLKIAQLRVVDNIEAIPEFFLNSWFKQIIASKSSLFWALSSILTFVLMLVSVSFYLFTRRLTTKQISFFVGLFLAATSFTTFIFSYKQAEVLTNRSTAIVMAQSVSVKSSPDQTGTDLFVIHEGIKVEIVDASGDWKEIRLKDGRKGWLLATSIAAI